MRIYILLCLLMFSIPARTEDRATCKSRDPTSEQSWNPPADSVTPRLRHFYDLGHRVEAAQEEDDVEEMEKLGREYLTVAEEYRCNWNYGNAIHDGNSALGLAALGKQDMRLAAQYLLKAARSPGSPQLDTFGPTMLLADKLVAAGDRDAVIAYLQDIRSFWHMDDGEIEKWVKQLKAGENPDFRMQLN